MKSRLTLAALMLTLSPLAHATMMTWDGNGNSYEVITGQVTLTWDQASLLAADMGGHLVTITSAAENDFVSNLVATYGSGDLQRYWLGGYQVSQGEVEPLGTWAWVTGEAWEYANWAPGEPNNGVGGSQQYLHYWPDVGLWDDMENRAVMDSFVIEYEVPEPTSLALLGLGLLGAGVIRRKRSA